MTIRHLFNFALSLILAFVIAAYSSISMAVPPHQPAQQNIKPPKGDDSAGASNEDFSKLLKDMNEELTSRREQAQEENSRNGFEGDQWVFNREADVSLLNKSLPTNDYGYVILKGTHGSGRRSIFLEYLRKYGAQARELDLTEFAHIDNPQSQVKAISYVIQQMITETAQTNNGQKVILFIDNADALTGGELIRPIVKLMEYVKVGSRFNLVMSANDKVISEFVLNNPELKARIKIYEPDRPEMESLVTEARRIKQKLAIEFPNINITEMALQEAARLAIKVGNGPFEQLKTILRSAVLDVLDQQEAGRNIRETLNANLEKLNETKNGLIEMQRNSLLSPADAEAMEARLRNLDKKIENTTKRISNLKYDTTKYMSALTEIKKQLEAFENLKAKLEKKTGFWGKLISNLKPGKTEETVFKVSEIDPAKLDAQIQDLRNRRDNLNAEIQKIDRNAGVPIEVTVEEVLESTSKLTGRSVKTLSASGKVTAAEYENLKYDVIGQDHVIDELRRLQTISDENLKYTPRPSEKDRKAIQDGLKKYSAQPDTVAMIGSSSTGKTYLAQRVAELRGRKLVIFDMGEYQDGTAVAGFIGAKPSYVGYGTPGKLELAYDENNGEIDILLDEIEKAHVSIQALILGLLSEGRITTGAGRTLDFKGINIYITSNNGQNIAKLSDVRIKELLVKEYQWTKERIQIETGGDIQLLRVALARESLKGTIMSMADKINGELGIRIPMLPELIARINLVVMNDHSTESIRIISTKYFSEFQDRIEIEGKAKTLFATERALNYISQFVDTREGVRKLQRTYGEVFTGPTGALLQNGELKPNDILIWDVNPDNSLLPKDRVQLKVVSQESDPSTYAELLNLREDNQTIIPDKFGAVEAQPITAKNFKAGKSAADELAKQKRAGKASGPNVGKTTDRKKLIRNKIKNVRGSGPKR